MRSRATMGLRWRAPSRRMPSSWASRRPRGYWRPARSPTLPGRPTGTSFAIYKSLQWAAEKCRARRHMSFVGPADPEMHRMLAAAYAKDMVLIAAAGNAGPNSAPLYPAADPNVIAVTATDSNDRLYNMANHGAYIAVAAPGVEIFGLAPGGHTKSQRERQSPPRMSAGSPRYCWNFNHRSSPPIFAPSS